MQAAAVTPEDKCQAAFYAAQWHMLRGNPAEGKAGFQIAVDTCPNTLIEYKSALAELARLNP
jgi:hypothetical protein